MSINYYAVPVRDQQRVGSIIEGDDVADKIDQASIRKALRAHDLLHGSEEGTLTWQVGNDYVFVDVLPTHVLVTHNTGHGSAQLEVLMDVLHRLRNCRLFVYDPQQGDWFPD
jgi:hypothetical protein